MRILKISFLLIIFIVALETGVLIYLYYKKPETTSIQNVPLGKTGFEANTMKAWLYNAIDSIPTDTAVHPDAYAVDSIKAYFHASANFRKKMLLSISDTGKITALDLGKNIVTLQSLEGEKIDTFKLPTDEINQITKYYLIESNSGSQKDASKSDMNIGDIIEFNSNYDMTTGKYTLMDIIIKR